MVSVRLSGMVRTSMTADFKGTDEERMIKPEDIAEAAMLAVRMSASACPQVCCHAPCTERADGFLVQSCVSPWHG